MRTKLFTLLLSLLCTGIVHAQTFNVDGLNYEVTSSINQEVSLVGGDDIPDPFIIPSTVSYDDVEYTVTSIGDNAFNCSAYNFSSVVFPETLRSIGSSAFSYCYSLSSITLSEGLTSIARYAFSYCSSLSSITFSEGLTSIGDYAFLGCSSLSSLIFPNSLANIGFSAFSDCSSLSSVTISDGLTSISYLAFYGCSSLESIDVTAGNQNFLSLDGVLFTKDGTSLICYPPGRKATSYAVPNEVSNVGDNAFSSCSFLSSIIFSEGLISIDTDAFYDCYSLSSITFPGSLKSIGEGAFVNCLSLESINVSADNQDFLSLDGVLFTKDKTTLLCYPAAKKSTSYTVPKEVISIADRAFIFNSFLASVTLSDDLKSIGYGSFAGCSSLLSISLPDGLTNIYGSAFNGCYSLSSIYSNAVTPPEAGDYNTFNDVDRNIPVYVPQESLEAYKTAPGWSNFTNFQGMTTSVDQPERQGGLSISDGKLHNAEGLLIEINDMNGRQVYRGTDTTVSLPSGVYVVRSKSSAFKIAL